MRTPPPPPPPPPNMANQLPLKRTFTVKTGTTRKGWKVGIYGQEGIGKSSLAALCPNAVFADIEGGMDDLSIPKVQGITDWTNLRAWVQSLTGGVAGIDSMTRAEDWAAQYVIANKKGNDNTSAVDSLEDFKYKAGLQYVVDEFKKLLADIDHARICGVSFIMISHLRVKAYKNPDGTDFIRHEPRLIDDPKVSNMLSWVQFLDHLAFIDLDKNVVRGKATGSGSRTIYLDTAPTRLCKARGIPNDPIPFIPNDLTFWNLLGQP